MELHEFEGATKLRLEYEKVKAHRDRLLTLLRELYAAAANPTILDDADTGVRLPPEWNERLKQALNERQTIVYSWLQSYKNWRAFRRLSISANH